MQASEMLVAWRHFMGKSKEAHPSGVHAVPFDPCPRLPELLSQKRLLHGCVGLQAT